MLPPLFQYKLVQLLPAVDRPPIDPDPSSGIRLNASSLNNEFFARACLEWRERLSEGEFMPENQMKLRADAEKEKSRLDPWKLKHFEPIWGRDKNHHLNLSINSKSSLHETFEIAAGIETVATASTSSVVSSSSNNTSSTVNTPSYTTISGRTVRHPTTFNSTSSTVQKRSPRTVGAMTRASAAAVVYQSPTDVTDSAPLPDVLPPQPKTPRLINMNAPEHPPVTTKDTAEPHAVSMDDIDTIVIPDDDPAITTSSGVTVTISTTSLPSSAAAPKPLIPTAYTIPPGIEVIPLDSNQSLNTIKRAHKRANSPDRNQIKISKFNDSTRSPNHSRPAHHHRSPIPSKPSPNHSSHNGTSCTVSDVIQIIKLPDVTQHLATSEKQSVDKTWTSLPESVPSMSVAVTTIAAAHSKERQPSNEPSAPPQIIELSKRPKTHPLTAGMSSSAMFVTSYPSNIRPNETPQQETVADIVKIIDAELPITNAVVDVIDNDLDVDESNYTESPADHVFRAMVCRGDDVLCGDNSVIAPHPEMAEEPLKSNLFYNPTYPSYVSGMSTPVENLPSNLLESTNEEPTHVEPPNHIGLSRVDNQCAGSVVAAVDAATVEELEPSIQSLDPLVELDPIEQEFNDAENYVLESGEISTDSVGE